MARSRKTNLQAFTAAADDATQLVDDAVLAAPATLEPADDDTTTEAVDEAPEPARKATRWVVPVDTRVSVFGQITNLPEGTVVSAADYGDVGMLRLHEQIPDLIPVFD